MSYGQFGPLQAMMHVQQQGEMGKQRGEQSRLARLVSQGMSAPGGLRSVVPEVASFNPDAAFALEDRAASQMEQRRRLLSDRARILSAMPVQQRAQAWPAMRAELAQIDPELGTLPEQYDDAQFGPVIQQLAGIGGNAATVRSSFVGEDGQMYSIMSDGSVKPQGVGADRKLQAFDVPGVGPQVVDLRNATARTVTAAQQPARDFRIDAGSMPADPLEAEAARRAMVEGGTFRVENGRVVPGQSGMQPAANRSIADTPINEYGGGPVGAPAWVRPASTQAQSELERRISMARQMGASDEEVRRMVVGGDSARDAQRISTADATKARQKMTQIAAAREQLKRVKEAFAPLQNSFSAGPGGAYLPTPDGEKFDRAVRQLAPLITAVTRVPGVGAMSDYESKLQEQGLPSRGTFEGTTEQQIADLEALLDTIEGGYKDLLNGGQAPSSGNNDTPQPGQVVDGYRFRGGNPADPNSWERV